ncbi:MAG: hypothetical protein QF732_12690, partial [Nitrospinaceae bacterium]|nr:hypothetical protein [Nitrospinaceae bacterium]
MARLAKGGLTAPEAARLGLEPRLAAELRRDGWRGDPGALGQAGVLEMPCLSSAGEHAPGG